MTKAVVLLSGGLDSTVALWWAKKKGWKCFALCFDYGQRHSRELSSARAIASAAKVPLEKVTFQLPWSRSSLTDGKTPLPKRALHQMSHHIPSTYVPGRNTIFLSLAMSFADQIAAQKIVIGANAIDYSGYPDCRGPYLSAFSRVATLGSRQGSEEEQAIKVVAPLLHLTKKNIVRLGVKLKAPLSLTWSCYQGGRKPCGTCDSCRLRSKGFEEAHVKEGVNLSRRQRRLSLSLHSG